MVTTPVVSRAYEHSVARADHEAHREGVTRRRTDRDHSGTEPDEALAGNGRSATPRDPRDQSARSSRIPTALAPFDSGSSTDTAKFTVVFPVAVTVIGGFATDTVGPITRIRPTSVSSRLAPSAPDRPLPPGRLAAQRSRSVRRTAPRRPGHFPELAKWAFGTPVVPLYSPIIIVVTAAGDPPVPAVIRKSPTGRKQASSTARRRRPPRALPFHSGTGCRSSSRACPSDPTPRLPRRCPGIRRWRRSHWATRPRPRLGRSMGCWAGTSIRSRS